MNGRTPMDQLPSLPNDVDGALDVLEQLCRDFIDANQERRSTGDRGNALLRVGVLTAATQGLHNLTYELHGRLALVWVEDPT